VVRALRRAAITPELLLRAYRNGLFPMGESRHDPTVYWIDPDRRGILPLDRFHIPRRLRRTLRRKAFEVRVDTAFHEVICACAEPATDRGATWINDEIIALYCELNRRGYAHSVECWLDNHLVGGLYGVSLRAAFFGESMFHHVTDASKVALVHLVERLRRGGYRLLDTQFVTEHLSRFGAVEIPRHIYLRLLNEALRHEGRFHWERALSESSGEVSPAAALGDSDAGSRHSITEMS